jgi:hypothetical protein
MTVAKQLLTSLYKFGNVKIKGMKPLSELHLHKWGFILDLIFVYFRI